MTLKVKYADFQQITRSRTAASPFATRAELERQSFELLAQLFPLAKGVRLLGVSLSSLDEERTNEKPQLSLALRFAGGAAKASVAEDAGASPRRRGRRGSRPLRFPLFRFNARLRRIPGTIVERDVRARFDGSGGNGKS